MHQLALELAPIAQHIIQKTTDPFVQPIYLIRPSLRVNSKNNIILLGDAAGTLPPQAGSGAMKGLMGALEISKAIHNNTLNE